MKKPTKKQIDKEAKELLKNPLVRDECKIAIKQFRKGCKDVTKKMNKIIKELKNEIKNPK